MNYSQIIDQALSLVKEDPTRKWRLEEIAQQVGYSPFHFHRIFKKVIGDTFHSYLTKQKLSHAIQELMETEDKIIDIAFKYQFGSPEVFLRQFKSNYFVTPSFVKKKKEYIRYFHSNLLHEQGYDDGSHNSTVSVQTIPPFFHAGVQFKFENIRTVANHWTNVIKQMESTPPHELIGVVKYVKERDVFYYSAGYRMHGSNHDSSFSCVQPIKHERYATMIHRGPYQTIDQSYQLIYTDWLPGSLFERAEGPQLEFYRENEEVVICVPIQISN